MKDRVIINGVEYVSAPLPPGRGRGSAWSVGADALAAMDQLGTDVVRCASDMSNGTASNWNKKAKEHGLPVQFFGRKSGDGHDIYAVRVKGGEK